MIAFTISPVDLMRTLTMALDLAVNGINKHQFRTAVICGHMATDMCLDPNTKQNLLCAALMHDIGAAPDIDEREKLASPEQERLLGESIFTHAEKGYELLGPSLCFSSIALAVRHHHDHWHGGNPFGTSKNTIPLESRIIHLADRVEVLVDKKLPILAQRESIRSNISARSGSQFDPQVTATFLHCSEKESFWLDITAPGYAAGFFDRMDWGKATYSAEDVLNIAELYATLIDRKSAFTSTHSRSVSQVATLLARHHGFCETELYMMNIAGLLHDLGKLSIPSSILEKPGPLTAEEMDIMRQHTYYTYRILERIDDMQTIAQWAALHHETLDGKGYPFKLTAESLPLGSRIMTVADIFVALTENRPYRASMEEEKVRGIMQNMADAGKIDGHALQTLFGIYAKAEELVRIISNGGYNTLRLGEPVCAPASPAH